MKKQRGLVEFVVILVFFGLVIGVTVALSYWSNSVRCSNRASMMGLKSDYAMWQGCMVYTGDRWAPIEYIRIVNGNVSIQGDGE